MNPNELIPHSIESEQSLLGALLIRNEAFDRVADILSADHFYREEHKRIYAHIAKLIEAGKEADVVTVFESLAAAGYPAMLGYLGELSSNIASAANARRYAEIVREKALLRGLLAFGNATASSALEHDGATAMDKVAKAEAGLMAIAEGSVKEGPVELSAVLSESIDGIERAHDGNVRRMRTGLIELDAMLYDLQPGALVIIAGRPAMGKTSLAVQVMEAIATEYGPVLMASLEMPRKQIGDRLLSLRSGVPLTTLASGQLNDEAWSSISGALALLHERPIHIDDKGCYRLAEVRAKAQTIRRKHGLKAIVIDYLQLMQGEGDNTNEQISSLTRGLKALAKQLEVPIILLSQLNRKVEERANKRPFMSDLRDSGAIEQDADLILFCYRDEYYNPDSPARGSVEVIIAKQRNGPTGTVLLSWQGECAKVGNLDHESARRIRDSAIQDKPFARKRGLD